MRGRSRRDKRAGVNGGSPSGATTVVVVVVVLVVVFVTGRVLKTYRCSPPRPDAGARATFTQPGGKSLSALATTRGRVAFAPAPAKSTALKAWPHSATDVPGTYPAGQPPGPPSPRWYT